jgi:hypothetical protein
MNYALLLGLLGLVAAARPAQAESRSVSQSTWSVSGRDVQVRVILPTSEARYLVPAGWPRLSTEAVAKYVLNHVSVQADGGPCPAVDQGFDIGLIDPLSVADNLYGFEILFKCTASTGIVLHNALLFDVAPQHVDFARIESSSGSFVPQLFTAAYQRLRIPEHATVPAAGFGRYLRAGFLHISRSLDRICFLLGLLLIAHRGREKLCILGGLSLGYAAAVALALGGWVVARMNALEAWLGFMVALTAALILAQQLRRSRSLAMTVAGILLALAIAALCVGNLQAALLLLGAGIFAAALLPIAVEFSARPLLWLLPTTLFGFLDGFVLPADLAVLRLAPQERASGLLAFSTGAVLADALLIGAFLGAAGLLRRHELTAPRALAQELATGTLAALGSFWLMSRLAL